MHLKVNIRTGSGMFTTISVRTNTRSSDEGSIVQEKVLESTTIIYSSKFSGTSLETKRDLQHMKNLVSKILTIYI